MKMNDACPLMQCEQGKTFLVRNISGDRCTRAKINSMGFTPGAKVHVCDSCRCGCRRVLVRDSSLVIDETIASAIMCEPCEFDAKADAACTL